MGQECVEAFDRKVETMKTLLRRNLPYRRAPPREPSPQSTITIVVREGGSVTVADRSAEPV